MFYKKPGFWLSLIIFLAFFIRVYRIGTLPLGTHPDEASWGYNAYSIIQTGKDEHGIKYPLIFKAFGDQKLPVFTYVIVPFIRVFGLNNFAVRLPAALIGSLTVWLFYLVFRQFKFSENVSLLGALVSATSPWLIILGRVFGFDSTFGLFFYTLAVWLSFVALNHHKKIFFVFASVSFAFAVYSYIAFRLVSPLTLLVFVYIFLRKTKKLKQYALLMGFSFLVSIIPLIWLTFTGTGSARFSQVFSTPFQGMVLRINENRNFCTQKLPQVVCKLNDNKPKAYLQSLIYRYSKTFSPDYLFLEGDRGDYFLNVENYGLLYFIFLPLYLLALFYFTKQFLTKKINQKEVFILLGLLITPLSALLVNDPNKVRLSGLSLFLIIFLLYGFKIIKQKLRKNYYQWCLLITGTLTILFALMFMVDFLIIHVHKHEACYQNDSTKLMHYLGKQPLQTQIYVQGIDEGIMLYAFLNQVDPKTYQQQVKRQPVNNIGFAHATDLLNIHITKKRLEEIYCLQEKDKKQVLYATSEDLINPKYFTKAQKIIYSENKVHKLKYVYNFSDLNNPNSFVCEKKVPTGGFEPPAHRL
jgi:4-amino-4-deoxy-L-arabinose transferase-like glycosyltransferase